MIAYYEPNLEERRPRLHPWTTAATDSSQRYIDFKSNPEQIRIALEDWVPFKREDFAESFFQLMEWLHGDSSQLESNDCAFRPAQLHSDAYFSAFSVRCDGRLMLLFRDIYANTQITAVDWLMNETMVALESVDREFAAGAVGLSFARSVYEALGKQPLQGALGHQLTLAFFAYGKDRETAHGNMNRLMLNVRRALEDINIRVQQEEHKKDRELTKWATHWMSAVEADTAHLRRIT